MEDLRITRLVINNVGVYEHLDLSFKKKQLKDKAEIHIFTGENGTGKTTLLEALTYFDFYFNKLLDEQKKNREEDDLLHKKGKLSKRKNRNRREDEEWEIMKFEKMHRRERQDEGFAIEIYFYKKELLFRQYGGVDQANTDFLKELGLSQQR